MENKLNVITMRDAYACLMYIKLGTDKSRTATASEMVVFTRNLIDECRTHRIPTYYCSQLVPQFLGENQDNINYALDANGEGIYKLAPHVTRNNIVDIFNMDRLPVAVTNFLDEKIIAWQQENGDMRGL